VVLRHGAGAARLHRQARLGAVERLDLAPPKIASERLGHTKVGITLDLYWHVPPNMLMDAVALLDDALRAAVQKLS
jgi:integrase